MIDILAESGAIKREADTILFDRGLHKLLCQYGEPRYAGSYVLDLMVKKDLDISLINLDLTLDGFFKLSLDVSKLLQPHSLHYRNTGIQPVANRPPAALYWGIVFDDWNIDLWLVDEGYHLRSVEYMEGIRCRLDPDTRRCILELKKATLAQKLYGKRVGSREIYEAVLQHEVRTYEQLCQHLGL